MVRSKTMLQSRTDDRATSPGTFRFAWLLLGTALACSSPTDEQSTSCAQGPSLTCVGEGNCEGTQYCEGGNYGACVCNSVGTGGSATGGAPTTGGFATGGLAPTGGVGPTGGYLATGGVGPLTGGMPPSGGTGGGFPSGGATGGWTPTGGVQTLTGGFGGQTTGGVSTGGLATGGAAAGGQATGGQPTGGAGTGGQPTQGVTYDCGIPPAGDGGKPRPTGTAANLQVLDWAGFASAISYTFDDSNSSQISHYDQMNSWGARYTFYLQTGKGESNDPVWQTALADGHELANHTQNHTCGGSDIDSGFDFIQQTFGITPTTLAAPNGDSACQSAGSKYLTIRSVSSGSIAPNDNTDPSWIPSNIPGGLGATAGRWQVYCIHGFTGGTDGAYQPIDFSSFETAVKDALAGGSWVDTVENVSAYWLGQKAFSSSGTDSWSWQLPEHFPANKCLRVTVDGGTLSQDQGPIAWDEHGYYEISLDAGSLSWSPD
jgi:hypothetical protein